MIDVSIVVPLYNSEKTIEKCLLSLLNQSFKNLVVIVVDDCSSDASANVVSRISKEHRNRIVLLSNDKNLGPSLTRKKGIDYANSKYIMFCDSDDYYEPFCVETFFNSMIKYNSDIVASNYFIVSKHKKRKHLALKSYDKYSFDEAITLPIDSLWSCCFKKELFDDILFPDFKNGEDMAIIPALISKSKKIATIDDCLYNYVYSKASLSNSSSSNLVYNLEKSFKYIEANLPSNMHNIVECLGIRNYLYGAALYLSKNDKKNKNMRELISCFEIRYPMWFANPFIKKVLPRHKIFFLKCLKNRYFCMMRLYSLAHSIVLGGI